MKHIKVLRLALQVIYEGEEPPLSLIKSLNVGPDDVRDHFHMTLRGMLRDLVDALELKERREEPRLPLIEEDTLRDKIIHHFGYQRDVGIIPMPFNIKQYNASGSSCDALEGPCSCGAWHKITPQDWPQEMLVFIEEQLLAPNNPAQRPSP